jgi:hypothetical protein
MTGLYNPLRVRASSSREFPISFSRVSIHRIKSIHIIRMDFKCSKAMKTLKTFPTATTSFVMIAHDNSCHTRNNDSSSTASRTIHHLSLMRMVMRMIIIRMRTITTLIIKSITLHQRTNGGTEKHPGEETGKYPEGNARKPRPKGRRSIPRSLKSLIFLFRHLFHLS